MASNEENPDTAIPPSAPAESEGIGGVYDGSEPTNTESAPNQDSDTAHADAHPDAEPIKADQTESQSAHTEPVNVDPIPVDEKPTSPVAPATIPPSANDNPLGDHKSPSDPTSTKPQAPQPPRPASKAETNVVDGSGDRNPVEGMNGDKPPEGKDGAAAKGEEKNGRAVKEEGAAEATGTTEKGKLGSLYSNAMSKCCIIQ